MKRLFLEEMSLVSPKEKKAKKIRFHPATTVILGDNDTGKSCLVKSIYWTFGAQVQFDNVWKQAQAVSFIRFRIDEEKYAILRSLDHYAVFDSNGKLLLTTNSVTNGLGPFLAKILSFGAMLLNRENKPVTPPPAYFFLPFYIDQDRGWNTNWASFLNLQQFKHWKKPIIEFHAGIYPNEYHRAKANIEMWRSEKEVLENELHIVQRVSEKVSKRHAGDIVFNVSIEEFKKDIEQLLKQCDDLKREEDRLKANLCNSYNQKAFLEQEIKIVEEAANELRKDFEFGSKIESDTIECPTCGQPHENSFANRFSIAHDEGKSYEYLLELKTQLKEVEDKTSKEKEIYDKNYESIKEIKAILETKKEKIKLKHLIEAEGKREVKKDLRDEVSSLEKQIAICDGKINEEKRVVHEFEDKKRKKEINEYYFDLLTQFINQLDIYKLNAEKYKKINCTVEEQGSDLPRGILAYYYSVLHTINKYSSSTFAPIIIDEPNQQGQDQENLPKMIKFIFEKQPKDSQLIMGLEDLRDVSFKGELIKISSDRSVLEESKFLVIWNEIKPYLDAIADKFKNRRIRVTIKVELP